MLMTIRKRLTSALWAFRNPFPLPDDGLSKKQFPFAWRTNRNSMWNWHLVNYDAYVAEGYSNEIVYSALKYKGDALAAVPLRAYTGDEQNPELAPDTHPLSLFAKRPNSYQSMVEFLQLAFTYIDLHGNSFIYVLGLGDGQSLQAIPLRPNRVLITPKADGTVVYFYVPIDGTASEAIPILPEQMIHIKYPNPKDPLEGQGYGVPPMSAAAKTIDVDNLMTRFLVNLFGTNGIMPGGVLEFPHEMDGDEMLKLRQQFVEEYGSVDEWGKPLVIDMGGKYRAAGMSLDDIGVDAMESRSIRRGLAPFGVPGILIGLDTESQTFSNYEQAENSFWTRTMFAMFKLFEIELRFRINLNDGAWLAFDFSGVPAFQENILEQTEVYTNLVQNFVPPNAAAQIAGLPIPLLKNGDVSYRPTNLLPVDEPIASTNGATTAQAQVEGETIIEEAASNPIQEALRKQRWDSDQKAILGKALDQIAVRHEQQFKDIATREFTREMRAILGILSGAKRKGLEAKATINYNEVTQLINRYMTLTSPQEWREAMGPAVVLVATESRAHWLRELDLGDDIGTFTLRNIEGEAWFHEYMLEFSRKVTRTTTDDIHAIIAQSLADGESNDVISNRIGNLFDEYITGNTTPEDWAFISERRPVWRTEMIARTETHRSSQAGSHFLFERAEIKLKEWLANPPGRTRDTHLEAQAQYTEGGSPGPIPINELFNVGGTQLLYPGDPRGDIRETVNCFLPDTNVSGTFVAGSKVWYSGPVWELETLRGYRLTITPNHPILTNRGWIVANKLIEGDYLLTSRHKFQSRMQRNINHENAPASIEDVFNTLGANGRHFVSMVTALDFDGDGMMCDNEVDIVYVDGILPRHINKQGRFQQDFQLQFIASSGLAGIFIDANSPPDFTLSRISIATSSIPSSGHLLLDSNRVGFDSLPFNPFSFGLAAKWDTLLGQKSRDNASITSEFFTELINASAGQVAPDKLIRIRECNFAGHVYDLQAIDGWILSENIVSGNCRCVELPVVE